MPNWVKNKIIVGSGKYIDEIKAAHFVKDKEGGQDVFDFNTVKKMPDELNVEFGSRSEDGIRLYLASIDPKCKFFGKVEEKVKPARFKEISGLMKDRMFGSPEKLEEPEFKDLADKYKEKLGEIVDIGRQHVQNAEKYGACNWYEWAVKNWGTKWNSSCTEVAEDGKSITFETAWEPALPVIVELSKQHPNIKMAFLYSDEEIGSRVGYALLTNGHVDFEGNFPDQSKDAYKLAFDLWGCADEYLWDEKKGKYVYKDQPIMSAGHAPIMG